jgi:hypothetical protein
MTVSGLVLPRLLQRPFKPSLPAGAPFCRRWWRTRDDWDSVDGAPHRALERASANIAYWRPGTAQSSRFTRVWDPAAIVRTLTATPTPQPATRLGPVRERERRVDLADGVPSIDDATTDDSLRLTVTWAGEPIGTVQIPHRGAVVSPLWVGDAIAQQLTSAVLDAGLGLGPQVSRALLTADLARYILPRWEAARPAASATPGARTAA